MTMTQTSARPARTYGTLGLMSAILSLLVLADVFGPVAIILGAYTWRKEPESSFGLTVLILGIVCMLVGIYFTAFPDLIDLIFGY